MIKSETVESFARMHADPVTFEPPSPVAFMVAVIPGWGAGHHSCPPLVSFSYSGQSGHLQTQG